MTYAGYYGILVHENHTVNLNEGDTIHYWIVRHFPNGTCQTIVNKNKTIQVLFTDISETHDEDFSPSEDSEVYHIAKQQMEEARNIVNKFKPSGLDLHEIIPHQPVPSKLYAETYSDEHTSYINNLIGPSEELSS